MNTPLTTLRSLRPAAWCLAAAATLALAACGGQAEPQPSAPAAEASASSSWNVDPAAPEAGAASEAPSAPAAEAAQAAEAEPNGQGQRRVLRSLADYARLVNARCPVNTSAHSSLTSVTMEGNDLVYRFELNEQALGVQAAALAARADVFRQSQRRELLPEGDDVRRAALTLLAASGGSLVYRYVGNESGGTFDVVLTSAELEQALR